MTTMRPPQQEHGGRVSAGSTGGVVWRRWRDSEELASALKLIFSRAAGENANGLLRQYFSEGHQPRRALARALGRDRETA